MALGVEGEGKEGDDGGEDCAGDPEAAGVRLVHEVTGDRRQLRMGTVQEPRVSAARTMFSGKSTGLVVAITQTSLR
jgi:hypothetical protein